MRGLIVCEPYASLIVAKATRFEFRTWRTHLRNIVVAISTGPRPVEEILKERAVPDGTIKLMMDDITHAFGTDKDWVYSAIIAVGLLHACHKITADENGQPTISSENPPTENELLYGDWTPGKHAFEFGNVIQLHEPISISTQSKVRLWDVPQDIARKVLEATT
jgi:hypothetical protein